MSPFIQHAKMANISDPTEIGMLENFFQNPEIIESLNEAEKYRKRRYMWLIPSILLVLIGITYFGSLGILQVEIGNNTHIYRPSTALDGFIWSIFGAFFVAGGIVAVFRSKIEGTIKQKILTKLSKELYSKLEYDQGEKFAFGDLDVLRGYGFLSSYDRIDTVEDSLGFTIQEDGKSLVVQGYELKTSEMRNSGKRRRRVTTNHCYLLKVRFPSARIPLEKTLLIKTDEADSIINGGLTYVALGAILGGFLGGFTGSTSLVILGSLSFGCIAFFWRRYHINKKRVALEDIEFEKLFDVQCEDQIGSRMIVTPAFMDRLVKLAKSSKYKYEFLYERDCFYIKWDISTSYLEVNTWKNITTNIGTFIDWYAQMKEIIRFIFDMRMLYFSKTDTSIVSTDDTLRYETMHTDHSITGGSTWSTGGVDAARSMLGLVSFGLSFLRR